MNVSLAQVSKTAKAIQTPYIRTGKRALVIQTDSKILCKSRYHRRIILLLLCVAVAFSVYCLDFHWCRLFNGIFTCFVFFFFVINPVIIFITDSEPTNCSNKTESLIYQTINVKRNFALNIFPKLSMR